MTVGGDGPDFSSLELSIDQNGNWRHQGVEITHPRVITMLHAALKKMGDGYFVCAEGLCLPVQVADCPFVVMSVRHEDGVVRLLLSNATYAPLNPETLTIDDANVPRCVARDDGATARFSRPAWMQLAEAIEEGEGGRFLLRIGEKVFPLREAKETLTPK